MTSALVFGVRDLRAMCRPPMGVPVTFNGVSAYPDDGTPICGLYDRSIQLKLMDMGIGGMESALPELRLPFNAFSPMPTAGASVLVAGIPYTVNQPTAEDDGAFLCYSLKANS